MKSAQATAVTLTTMLVGSGALLSWATTTGVTARLLKKRYVGICCIRIVELVLVLETYQKCYFLRVLRSSRWFDTILHFEGSLEVPDLPRSTAAVSNASNYLQDL